MRNLILSALLGSGGAVLLASPASAEVFASWNECAVAGSTYRASACSSNVGEHRVVLTLKSSESRVGVRGFFGTVSVSGFGALPDWWKLQASGGCRSALTASIAFDDPPHEDGLCRDAWRGLGTFVLYRYLMSGDRLGIAIDVLLSEPVDLAAEVPYVLVEFRISNVKTVGDDACSGCRTTMGISPTSAHFMDNSGIWTPEDAYNSIQWQ